MRTRIGMSPSPKFGPRLIRRWPLALLMLLSIASIGCGALSQQSLPQGLSLPIAQLAGPPTAIGTLSQPGQNQRVTVQGQVKQRAPLTAGWLYRLEDESGSIWVRSQAVAPPLDSWIRLEGQLQYRQILVDGNDQGEHYLEEQSRRPVETESEDVES